MGLRKWSERRLYWHRWKDVCLVRFQRIRAKLLPFVDVLVLLRGHFCDDCLGLSRGKDSNSGLLGFFDADDRIYLSCGGGMVLGWWMAWGRQWGRKRLSWLRWHWPGSHDWWRFRLHRCCGDWATPWKGKKLIGQEKCPRAKRNLRLDQYAKLSSRSDLVDKWALIRWQLWDKFVSLCSLWHNSSTRELALLQWRLHDGHVPAQVKQRSKDHDVHYNFWCDRGSLISLLKAFDHGNVLAHPQIWRRCTMQWSARRSRLDHGSVRPLWTLDGLLHRTHRQPVILPRLQALEETRSWRPNWGLSSPWGLRYLGTDRSRDIWQSERSYQWLRRKPRVHGVAADWHALYNPLGDRADASLLPDNEKVKATASTADPRNCRAGRIWDGQYSAHWLSNRTGDLSSTSNGCQESKISKAIGVKTATPWCHQKLHRK